MQLVEQCSVIPYMEMASCKSLMLEAPHLLLQAALEACVIKEFVYT